MKTKILKVLLISGVVIMSGCEKNINKVQITAHRGASGLAPENTMVAMVKAMEIGSDFSELDVQETADGMIVLMHDDSLQRTTGLEAGMWERTFDELNSLEAGAWFSEEFKGEPIPTLKSIIDSVRGKMKLNIELKMNGHQKLLTEKVVKIVEEENFIDKCILTSFDFSEVRKIRQLNKTIKIGYIFSKMPEDEDVFTADVDLLSVNKKLVTEDFVKKAHANNKEVHVWTVNQAEDMHKLITLGVDNIITNYPNVLKEILAGK
jgi:glycerophosphoryl diester phosphodiesterase